MKQIEDTFKEFTSREDIAIVLINQFVRTFTLGTVSLDVCTMRIARCLVSWCYAGSVTFPSLLVQVADLIRHKVDDFKEVLTLFDLCY